MNHYGKKIENLNEKERELLYLDCMMSCSMLLEEVAIFNPLTSGKKKEIKKQLDYLHDNNLVLCEKRTNLVSEILGIKDKHIAEKASYIEHTKYSFKKFVEDMRRNRNEEEELIRLSILN